jgi:hypothetical protein
VSGNLNLLGVLEAAFTGGVKETDEVSAAHIADLVDTVVANRLNF